MSGNSENVSSHLLPSERRNKNKDDVLIHMVRKSSSILSVKRCKSANTASVHTKDKKCKKLRKKSHFKDKPAMKPMKSCLSAVTGKCYGDSKPKLKVKFSLPFASDKPEHKGIINADEKHFASTNQNLQFLKIPKYEELNKLGWKKSQMNITSKVSKNSQEIRSSHQIVTTSETSLKNKTIQERMRLKFTAIDTNEYVNLKKHYKHSKPCQTKTKLRQRKKNIYFNDNRSQEFCMMKKETISVIKDIKKRPSLRNLIIEKTKLLSESARDLMRRTMRRQSDKLIEKRQKQQPRSDKKKLVTKICSNDKYSKRKDHINAYKFKNKEICTQSPVSKRKTVPYNKKESKNKKISRHLKQHSHNRDFMVYSHHVSERYQNKLRNTRVKFNDQNIKRIRKKSKISLGDTCVDKDTLPFWKKIKHHFWSLTAIETKCLSEESCSLTLDKEDHYQNVEDKRRQQRKIISKNYQRLFKCVDIDKFEDNDNCAMNCPYYEDVNKSIADYNDDNPCCVTGDENPNGKSQICIIGKILKTENREVFESDCCDEEDTNMSAKEHRITKPVKHCEINHEPEEHVEEFCELPEFMSKQSKCTQTCMTSSITKNRAIKISCIPTEKSSNRTRSQKKPISGEQKRKKFDERSKNRKCEVAKSVSCNCCVCNELYKCESKRCLKNQGPKSCSTNKQEKKIILKLSPTKSCQILQKSIEGEWDYASYGDGPTNALCFKKSNKTMKCQETQCTTSKIVAENACIECGVSLRKLGKGCVHSSCEKCPCNEYQKLPCDIHQECPCETEKCQEIQCTITETNKSKACELNLRKRIKGSVCSTHETSSSRKLKKKQCTIPKTNKSTACELNLKHSKGSVCSTHATSPCSKCKKLQCNIHQESARKTKKCQKIQCTITKTDKSKACELNVRKRSKASVFSIHETCPCSKCKKLQCNIHQKSPCETKKCQEIQCKITKTDSPCTKHEKLQCDIYQESPCKKFIVVPCSKHKKKACSCYKCKFSPCKHKIPSCMETKYPCSETCEHHKQCKKIYNTMAWMNKRFNKPLRILGCRSTRTRTCRTRFGPCIRDVPIWENNNPLINTLKTVFGFVCPSCILRRGDNNNNGWFGTGDKNNGYNGSRDGSGNSNDKNGFEVGRNMNNVYGNNGFRSGTKNCILNFLFRGRNRRRGMLRRREAIEYDYDGTNMYLLTLRNKKYLNLHRNYPRCYPHYISMIKGWQQCGQVVLFCLACVGWIPCFLVTEMCRVWLCCLFCSN